MAIMKYLKALNVGTGKRSTPENPARLRALENLLKGSPWELKKGGNYLLCTHKDAEPAAALTLVTSHIDSCYPRHFITEDASRLLGTFDNSAPNAAVVKTMLESDGALNNVIFAFTGGEETGFGGVRELLGALSKAPALWRRLELAIATDVTFEKDEGAGVSLENLFREKANRRSLLKFKNREEYLKWVAGNLRGGKGLTGIVECAAPDEAHEFRDWDLNAFSLCLPTAPGEDGDMHSPKGIWLETAALRSYSDSLARMLGNIAAALNPVK